MGIIIDDTATCSECGAPEEYKEGLCIKCFEKREPPKTLTNVAKPVKEKPGPTHDVPDKPLCDCGEPVHCRGKCIKCYQKNWLEKNPKRYERKKRKMRERAQRISAAKKTKPEAIPMPKKKAEKKTQDAEISGVMGELFDDLEDLKDRIEKLKIKYFGG